MLKLSERWVQFLMNRPETGMGHQIARIVLNDGRTFERVVILDGAIHEVDHALDIPFAEPEIREIQVRSGLEWDRHR